MIRGIKVLFAVVLFHVATFLAAQENIPLGTWRYHISYSKIVSLDIGQQNIYAAPPNGVMIYDPSDQQAETITRLNGLTKAGIKIVRYHEPAGQLLVVYDDGTFDAIRGAAVTHVDPSRNAVITGRKDIHGVTIENNVAYFSTEYGVLLFDLNSSRIKETWRDLGKQGSTLPVFQSVFTSDSVFLATGNGVIAGKRTDNLLDFNMWKRYDSGDFEAAVTHLAIVNDDIIAAVDGMGLYQYHQGTWTLQNQLQGGTFNFLRASSNILLTADGGSLWRMTSAGEWVQINDELITNANDAVETTAGEIWIADASNGLLRRTANSTSSVKLQGPSSDAIVTLAYGVGAMHALQGGYSAAMKREGNPGLIDKFSKGAWTSSAVAVTDLTGIAFSRDKAIFVSSFGQGILQTGNSAEQLWDNSNSTLIDTGNPERGIPVTNVLATTAGLWATTYGTQKFLHLLDASGWKDFALPDQITAYPLKIAADVDENVWITIAPQGGGGILVYNPGNNEWLYRTNQSGNGFLPSMNVNVITTDRDGYMWVGTDQGVAYFYSYREDAVRPIFESRFLLAGERVKAIAVDGGNRKWIGTERGLWLFNPTGEELIGYFTMANSPLPSDNIADIQVDPVSGEVFIVTDRGLCSYRSNSTESRKSFTSVKIFPNPVNREFSGLVGITGVATDAIIKITDVSGKLVWQSQANGGTASWNVQDVNGRRVSTGIFLVYAVTQDGTESVVGKIAVIN